MNKNLKSKKTFPWASHLILLLTLIDLFGCKKIAQTSSVTRDNWRSDPSFNAASSFKGTSDFALCNQGDFVLSNLEDRQNTVFTKYLGDYEAAVKEMEAYEKNIIVTAARTPANQQSTKDICSDPATLFTSITNGFLEIEKPYANEPALRKDYMKDPMTLVRTIAYLQDNAKKVPLEENVKKGFCVYWQSHADNTIASQSTPDVAEISAEIALKKAAFLVWLKGKILAALTSGASSGTKTMCRIALANYFNIQTQNLVDAAYLNTISQTNNGTLALSLPAFSFHPLLALRDVIKVETAPNSTNGTNGFSLGGPETRAIEIIIGFAKKLLSSDTSSEIESASGRIWGDITRRAGIIENEDIKILPGAILNLEKITTPRIIALFGNTPTEVIRIPTGNINKVSIAPNARIESLQVGDFEMGSWQKVLASIDSYIRAGAEFIGVYKGDRIPYEYNSDVRLAYIDVIDKRLGDKSVAVSGRNLVDFSSVSGSISKILDADKINIENADIAKINGEYNKLVQGILKQVPDEDHFLEEALNFWILNEILLRITVAPDNENLVMAHENNLFKIFELRMKQLNPDAANPTAFSKDQNGINKIILQVKRVKNAMINWKVLGGAVPTTANSDMVYGEIIKLMNEQWTFASAQVWMDAFIKIQ